MLLLLNYNFINVYIAINIKVYIYFYFIKKDFFKERIVFKKIVGFFIIVVNVSVKG